MRCCPSTACKTTAKRKALNKNVAEYGDLHRGKIREVEINRATRSANQSNLKIIF